MARREIDVTHLCRKSQVSDEVRIEFLGRETILELCILLCSTLLKGFPLVAGFVFGLDGSLCRHTSEAGKRVVDEQAPFGVSMPRDGSTARVLVIELFISAQIRWDRLDFLARYTGDREDRPGGTGPSKFL